MALVTFQCPKCGMKIDALPSARPAHRCWKANKREVEFVIVEEKDAS